ncbi:unnamed protein product, partial [Sphenostylis stenocarpa]
GKTVYCESEEQKKRGLSYTTFESESQERTMESESIDCERVSERQLNIHAALTSIMQKITQMQKILHKHKWVTIQILSLLTIESNEGEIDGN